MLLQYLELRYQSKAVRVFGSTLGIIAAVSTTNASVVFDIIQANTKPLRNTFEHEQKGLTVMSFIIAVHATLAVVHRSVVPKCCVADSSGWGWLDPPAQSGGESDV